MRRNAVRLGRGPEYRSFSLSLMQRIANQPHVDLLLTTTVGPAAEPSLAAFQWSRVPAGQWDRAALDNRAPRVPAERLWRGSWFPLAGLAAYPLALALSCRDGLSRGGVPRRIPLANREKLEFDSTFDVFLGSAEARQARRFAGGEGARRRCDGTFEGAGRDAWIVTASLGRA